MTGTLRLKISGMTIDVEERTTRKTTTTTTTTTTVL